MGVEVSILVNWKTCAGIVIIAKNTWQTGGFVSGFFTCGNPGSADEVVDLAWLSTELVSEVQHRFLSTEVSPHELSAFWAGVKCSDV